MMKIKVFGIVTVLLFMCKFFECDYMPPQQQPLFCSDLRPQNDIDIEKLLGIWYGNDIIMHHKTMQSDESLNSCVTIHLTDITTEIASSRPRQPDSFQQYHNQQSYFNYGENQLPQNSQYYHYLKLVWSEENVNIDYTLRFNTTRRGFWISSSPQSGKMQKLNYGQFNGVIQVMKVVNNQLILTFCENTPGKQFFTIILSRQPNSFSDEDLASVHSLLRHRNLDTVSVRKVCNGATSMPSISIISMFITAALSFVLKHF